MKIRCEYCNSMFDDTLEKCPSCGAPNQNVRRSTSDQPTTIEGLKEWYQRMGLPPYETTRFFIGINYTGRRAFGIYQDERSGNFVVYKNKDDGSRAIRYEGTDEAYAVNELHTRLKQEILQQKGRNINQAKNSYARPGRRRRKKSLFSTVITLIMIGVPMFFMLKFMAMEMPSQQGYYMYNDSEYYKGKLFYHYNDKENGFAVYDTELGDWKKADSIPSEIKTRMKAKDYFLSSDYKSSLGAYDFNDSIIYEDLQHNFQVTQGYYSYDNSYYYHMKEDQDAGWYVYDDDDGGWDYIWGSDVPSELKHQTVAQDFWYTPTWSEDTQITDFRETEDYQEYQEDLRRQAEYEASHSSDNDSSSSDYSWSSSDSWDSGSTDWGSDW